MNKQTTIVLNGRKKEFSTCISGIFLGLIWGRISAPSQLKNEQKLPKMAYIILNFLVLHFGENFMKIRTKVAMLQMHENLHKNVNENMFSFTFLCKFSWVFIKGIIIMLQLYTAIFLYILKAIKNATGTSVIFPINTGLIHFVAVLNSIFYVFHIDFRR